MNRRIAGILIAAAIAAGVCGCSEKGPRTVKLVVSDRGFVPARITVKKGVPVTLLVTREVEATCATELVIEGVGIHKELPLHQEVSVTFTPDKKGDLRYTCPMDMIAGSIRVE
jgi:plastocyanin domain-containing protein